MCDSQEKYKKYRERPSPAYPANECCGQEKRGNDGKMWKSVRNSIGVCSWKLMDKSPSANKRASPKKELAEVKKESKKSPSKKSTMTKKSSPNSRCPNGFHRNKKTGNCEEKK